MYLVIICVSGAGFPCETLEHRFMKEFIEGVALPEEKFEINNDLSKMLAGTIDFDSFQTTGINRHM